MWWLGVVGYSVLSGLLGMDGVLPYGLALTIVGILVVIDWGDLIRNVRRRISPQTEFPAVWRRSG